MSNSHNRLSQFWLELKRRKVVRVITVYAASAFVILELTSIVSPSLRLPEWTLNFVILLLCVGFIIAVILSWIYDVHPDGEIVKTRPTHKMKLEEEVPKSSGSWKIASYISFVVIVGLLVLNIIPRSEKNKITDKSIAVLPFIDDSPDKNNEHIINGIMEDLLINLQSIKELRVPGRTSTEQYRNNPKPIPEIASAMNVAYILEGSGQRYGNRIRLRVQLIEGASDKHIWADSYDEVIHETEDIFKIQSQIAKAIASELQAVITEEEKQQIEKIPTTSLTAYELYHKGREEFYKYYKDKDKKEALLQAKEFYRSALESDPEFALAYTGLAQTYWYQLGIKWHGDRPENCLDSVLILADMGLSYDDQLVDGYILRGDYYSRTGQRELAIEEYNKALQLNPNHWTAYHQLGHFYIAYDFIKSFSYYYKAVPLIHGSEEPTFLRRGIWRAHNHIGFTEKSDSFLLRALELDGDSLAHYSYRSYTERCSGNYEKALVIAKKGYALDSTDISIFYSLAGCYFLMGQYKEAIRYYEKIIERSENHLLVKNILGYAYWKTGFEQEAERQFRDNIRRLHWKQENEVQGEPENELWLYYGLAGAYVFLGEKEKAYEYLRIFLNKRQIPHRSQVLSFKIDPVFDRIRDEPEFQQIVREVEAKYQAEHDRVRQWLEEIDR